MVQTANAVQLARFQAARARVFRSMRETATRTRTAMLVPFHLVVVAALFACGAPWQRLAAQLVASVLVLAALHVAERSTGRRSLVAFVLAGVGVLVNVGNTGGVFSPLLLSVVPFLVGSSVHPNVESKRYAHLLLFLAGFATMAFASSMPFESICATTPRNAHRAFLGLSLLSATLAGLAVFKVARAMIAAYEQIAFELAEQRDELCDENEGRTRSLEGIAARLAHEVKNPLAAIRGLSTHLARNAADERVKERLTMVASEAERLQSIVDGFLSFSRGLDELSIAPTNPFDVARGLVVLLESRAHEAGVTLDVRGCRELTLQADEKKLRQALLNLVLNATQASPSGATVTLEIAKNCADNAAVIRVMDRGEGMSPAILERIARPYFTTKDGGSGLGIAITRGILEQHGGSLRFESAEGRGTTATVTLPPSATTALKLPNPCRSAVELVSACAKRAYGDLPERPSIPMDVTEATIDRSRL